MADASLDANCHAIVNRRILVLVVLVALVIVAVSMWLLVRGDIPPKPSEIASTSASARSTTPVNTTTQTADSATPSESANKPRSDDINWKAIGEIMEGRFTILNALTDALVEEFLRKRGETAINLLVAWESTGKRRWLDRALELFPNDPALLLAAIADDSRPEGHTELIDRLKTVAPENPLVWVFSARQLFEKKRNAEAMAQLRAALTKPGFYNYTNERILASRQLYQDAGLDPLSAEFLAMMGLPTNHSAPVSISRALRELANDPAASPEARGEIAEVGYGLGGMFATPEASRMLIGQLVGISIETHALKLAQTLESNPLPVEPVTRLAELDRQKAEVREITSGMQELLAKPDATLLSDYLRRLRTEGERNALRWLKTRFP